MDEIQAQELRSLVSQLSNAVEARIRGEAAAGEAVRRAAQDVHIAAVGHGEYFRDQLYQPLKNICLVMAQELGILPAINAESAPVTAADVANKIHSEELLVARIMRVLTSVGICIESGPNTYKANQLSQIVASLGGQAGVKIVNELLFPVAAQLVPYIREHGFKQFPQRPQEMDPTQFTFGGKEMFQYFKDNPEIKQWFDTLMAQNRKFNVPWYQIYPFADELGQACKEQPDRALLVDVGGNRGADIREFHEKYPELPGRLILQDLPETIQAVDKSSMGAIELHPYDFFTPQAVKGAKAYFWRWVLHDFGDDSVRKFLPNTVQAMDKDSKLLIEELVLPEVGTDTKCSHLDILMMLYHSGMERTLSQWRILLGSCGLEIVKVWTRPDTDSSVLECGLK